MSEQLAALAGAKEVCVRSLQIMAAGDLKDFEAVIHPEAVNREAVAEPGASRGRGPEAFHATALWLRGAFSGLRWERQTGPSPPPNPTGSASPTAR